MHHYVNKETLILTAIGAALGVPLGGLLAESFTYILQMPSLYFDVEVEPLSYVLAVVLSFGFTFIVNLATNRTLNKIDMVAPSKAPSSLSWDSSSSELPTRPQQQFCINRPADCIFRRGGCFLPAGTPGGGVQILEFSASRSPRARDRTHKTALEA